ncbi:MAG: methyltransferase domain-containing protein, partial [Acidobacteria bacterium]|nr:methyltransferase domain-containing protein [Acidobacteriota bacterium]
RVLEIGCGTGLLLFRVAPHCERYLGTNFSQVVLDRLEQQVEAGGFNQVSLRRQEASDFAGIEPASCDLVIINSVVQYFPSIDYLVEVVEGAVRAVAPGGRIFIGDVRNYELLEAFHASVELHRAAATLPVEQLRQLVHEQVVEENELVIAPGFFTALKGQMPQISRVEVLPKRGYADNELTRFRYDVVLHVGEAAAADAEQEVAWKQWDKGGLSIARVRQLLEETRPELLGIARVPNGRVIAETRIMEMTANKESLPTAGELREALEQARQLDGEGVNPEQLWAIGEGLPYAVEVSWAGSGPEGSFDVLLRRNATDGKATDEAESSDAARGGKLVRGAVRWPGVEKRADRVRAWSFYANQPLARSLFRTLVPQLREYLQGRLPEYMVPQAFVLLDEMPLTPNGKVDRRALPAPDRTRPELEAEYVAPRSAVEEVVAGIWSEVLDVEQVGVADNFFELGGHSLLATQVVSRLREALQVEVPLRTLFEQPTVAGLVKEIVQIWGGLEVVEEIARTFKELEQLSEDEVRLMLSEQMQQAEHT